MTVTGRPTGAPQREIHEHAEERGDLPVRQRLWGTLGRIGFYLAGCIVTGALAIVAGREGPLVVVALVALLVILLVAATQGLQSITYVALGAALVTTTSIGLRLTENITFSDLLLVFAIVLALASGPRLYPLSNLWRISMTACGLVIGGGIIGNVIIGNPEAGYTRLAQFSAATFMCLLLVAAFRPSQRALTVLAACYGGGALLTATVGLTENSDLRPVGLSLHANHLALGCLLGASMLLAIVATRPRLIGKLAALGGWTVLVTAVVASGSRAGLVGLVIATILTLVGLRARRLMVAAGIAMIIVTIGLLTRLISLPGGNALSRLLGIDASAGESDVGRTIIYDRTLEAIDASPLLGSGFVSGRSGHSVYLQYWEAAGILGLLGIVLIVGVAAGGWVISFNRRDGFSVVLWSGFVGYLAAAIASNQMWDRYIWLALGLALLSSMSWKRERAAAVVPRSHLP